MASNNWRIVKNTIYLYLRTFIVLVVSLYISRMILKILGVEDLGIYNVVGGIVSLMVFLRSTLSRSTSRFITYEQGVGSDRLRINQVFSAALTIHLLMAGIVLVLGETVGLYIFYNLTDIPDARRNAAFVVYQCALVNFCIHILTSPYEAIVIAHEKMQVFAYFSLLSAFLKLGVVFLLEYVYADKLILYGLLVLACTLVVGVGYVIYIHQKFPIYKESIHWDNKICREMLSFSGWTLMGSASNAASMQGVSLLFNNFVGLVANAALGFANQVNGAMSTFVSSFQTSFNPQIIKLYSQGDSYSMHLLMRRASKFSFALSWLLAWPLLMNMDFVLSVWLSDVPEYTVGFCRMILVCSIIDSVTGVFNTSIMATGKIKWYQICISVSFLLDFCCIFIMLACDIEPVLVFASRIVTRGIINACVGFGFVKRQLLFNMRQYCQEVLLPIFITISVSLIAYIVTMRMPYGWNRLIISSTLSVSILALCAFWVIMNRTERKFIFHVIKQKFHKS